MKEEGVVVTCIKYVWMRNTHKVSLDNRFEIGALGNNINDDFMSCMLDGTWRTTQEVVLVTTIAENWLL